MARISVLVDQPANRRLLLERLGPGHEVSTRVTDHRPDLVVADLPAFRRQRDEVAEVRADDPHGMLPVLLLLPEKAPVWAVRGVGDQIDAVLQTPVSPRLLDARIANLLRLRFIAREQHEQAEEESSHRLRLAEEVRLKTRELQGALADTVQTLTRAAEYRDVETGAHIQRVGYYCRILSDHLGMDREFQETVFHASPMHDIGKIAVPDAVLLKPGRLDDEEAAVMRNHPEWGEDILKGKGSPYLAMGAEIARGHHERWDGTGYPDGLAGEAIPLPARLMSVADVYDALRSRRPYKEPFDHAATMGIILEGDGRTDPAHFDPACLDAFQVRADDFAAVFDSIQDTG